MTTTDDMRLMVARELEAFAREMELFPDDEMPWATPPGISNSAGSLARHVCGNLKHYVGHVLGGSDYVRNREAEFSARSGTRHELARELRETAGVVSETLPRVEASTLAKDFPEAVGGVTLPCERFLLHLCVHLAFHLGQAGYLRRLLTGQNESSGPISIRAIAWPDGPGRQ